MGDDFTDFGDAQFINCLSRGQDDDALGNLFGSGEPLAGIGLQGAVGLHAVASGPEILAREHVVGMKRFDEVIS